MKKLIYGILLILAFAANSCKNGKVTPKQFQTETRSQWNGQTIHGTVKNMNSERISFVGVEYDILDDKNRVIRTVSASSDKGIEPNGEWDFEIEAVAAGARITRLKSTVTR